MAFSVRPKWIVASLAALVLTAIEYLNFSGFCYSNHRYYSDQEFRDAAVRSVLSDQAKRSSSQQYFSSLREFYNDNLDCCRIYRWHKDDDIVSPWARLFGWYVALIDVTYRLPWQAENQYFYANAYADACTAVFKIYTIENTRENLPRVQSKP